MLMFASGIVGGSEVKLRQQKGVSPEAACASRLTAGYRPWIALVLERGEYRRDLWGQ